jgi:hypothetical protein
MLANDQTLDNANGTDVVYRLVSQNQDGTRRIDIASTLALPSVLSIKHSTSGKPPNVVDRHLIQVSKTVATALGTATLNANFTLTIPRDTAVTTTMVHDVVSNILDFLSDSALTGFASTANVDAILRGES